MDRESQREENRAFVRNGIASVKELELSGERFLEWKILARNILECAGLWDVVDPDQKVDSRGVSSDGVSNDDRKRKARAIIQESVAFYINGNRDPRECWIYLQNRFAPNTAARRFEFTRRLLHLRMEEGENVQEFSSRVQDVLNHLHDMGLFIEEKLLVMILINALPRSWNSVGSGFWDETDTLTKDELYRRMKLVESRNEARRGLERGRR